MLFALKMQAAKLHEICDMACGKMKKENMKIRFFCVNLPLKLHRVLFYIIY